ncbi:biotin--[acetyl-CoA-carboxylase] ligase [Adhaeribacter aquaticus]|uniref:biotin--[acetyl-CoA-carboxylase] ligase n=1 Tax=Adhaeribacter aquaticus TaxID=299567 RepID=UPI00047B49FA|nr:biotin--[acetyl-CoA-carboxylase] ligase [Adhaeribacter aquaticus]
MHNIAPSTLFTGHQLVYLPECDSTNSVAHELIIKNKATEGCVVITDRQTQGRGQRGNSWEAAPGQNITLSVILKPNFLNLNFQFYLNISVALAVLDFSKQFLPELPGNVKVKWPNDIYYGNYKLGGILIENTISGHFLQQSIIGIGLNINQISFAYPNATSLAKITDKQYNLGYTIEKLLEFIEARYLLLKEGKMEKLRFDYFQNLFRYQENYFYKKDDEIFLGKILGVNEQGQLGLQINEEVKYFNFKELSYII